jgi:RHS repeat-associated protein
VPVVTQERSYYSFGLAIEGLAYDIPNWPNYPSLNKYNYNGKEFISDIDLQWYDYGMRQYDAQIGRFHCIDRFTEKYSSLSPYNYAANNPILLIDMNGDSLAIDQSIYSNKVLNQAFQIFANSKAGRAYLSQFAKAGQKLYGYSFKESGKYDTEGMNMAYTTGKSEDSEKGSTSADNSNKTITVTMCTDQIKDESNESIYSATQTFTHESFIHGDLGAIDYMQDGSFNSSNISQKAKEMASGFRPNFQHYQVYLNYAKNRYNTQWPGQGYSVLQQANSILKLNKTPQRVVQQMWNYSGGVNIDNKGNATEFNR